MGIFSRFFPKKTNQQTTYISGIGAHSKLWNGAIDGQEITRAILDCNATHTAKAQVFHVVQDKQGRVKQINRSSPYTKLFQQPNPLMSTYDFLYATSWQLDLKNTALAWIQWDEAINPKAIWPIAYQQFEFRQIIGGGYAVQFYDMDGEQHLLPLEDMVILRRHYDASGIAGNGNAPVTETIQMVQNIDEGLSSATNVSGKIFGMIKQKETMLSPDDVKKSQDEFVSRMSDAAKNGGIVSLDATENYVPLPVSTWAANAAQMQQITDRLYSYWRTPREVVNNTASEQTMQNYYDAIIEPRWLAMSQAFTTALFSQSEKNFGNKILIFGGAATGASWQTKLNIVTDTKELGLLTTNEYRELLGYAPVENGDKRLVSLNYIKAEDMTKHQTNGKDDGENAV